MRFVGDRLRVGRTYRDMTLRELGSIIAISTPVLSRIESDKKEPDDVVVDAIAETLGFTRDFFYRDVIDEFTQKECSFRRKVQTPQKIKNRILAQGTLLAEMVRCLRTDIRFPVPDIPRITCWSREAVEEAAEACRRHWEFGEGPISNMIRVLEGKAGVMVFRLHDESDHVDAFSRPGEIPFVILNDAKGSSSRARSDLAHELGHLVMHNGETDDHEEKQAQHFAGAFLLPAGAFGRHFRACGSNPSWAHLFELKKHWKVSVGMIVQRAYELGLISATEYLQRRKHIMYKGWHRGEPHEPPVEHPEVVKNGLEKLLHHKRNEVRDFAQRLGWTAETFTAITGISFASNVDRDPDVIPLSRAWLSIA